MTVSFELNKDDEKVIRKYVETHNTTVENLFRKAVFDMIENAYDLEEYDESIEDYNANPTVYKISDKK